MTHEHDDRRRRLIYALRAVALLALAGCAMLPISQTVSPGATIAVPVAGERATILGTDTEYKVGFASPVTADPQRGSLLAFMCPTSVTTTIAGCNVSSSKVSLAVRYVTRAYPDPASIAGISNVVSDQPGMGFVPMSGQTLLFVDIPSSLNTTLWPANCSSNPVAACLTTFQYIVWIAIHPPSGPDDLSTLGFAYYVSLSRGTGTQNTASNLYGSGVDLTRYVPYPKVVFVLDAPSQGNVAAADITINVPSNITVKDVFEEEHLGRHTLVLWKRVGAGPVKVQLVAPAKDVKRIALAFELTDTTPVTLGQFSSTQILYNDTGTQIGGNFQPAVIR